MLREVSLTSRRDPDLLGTFGKMDFRMGLWMGGVAAHKIGVAGFRYIDQEETLLHLVNLLTHENHLELLQVLDDPELLHVKGAQTSVVKPT